MATTELILTTTLVASVQNITLPVTDPYTLYEITSASPIVIPGTSTFNTSGTLYEGLTYNFRYTATVTSGNVQIMGENIPSHLRSKDCDIEAYYNGTSWDISFLPDMSQNGVVSNGNLELPQGSLVTSSANISAWVSAVGTGPQTLRTMNIAGGSLQNAGDLYRVTALGTCNAGTKAIRLKINSGAFIHTIFVNTGTTTITGGFKIDAYVHMDSSVLWQSNAVITAGGSDTNISYSTNGTNLTFGSAHTIDFIAEEYSNNAVASTTSLVGGTGYTTAAAVATTGGTGTGCTVNTTVSAGVVTSITIASGGLGYTIGDVLTITGGGANATFQVNTLSPTPGGLVQLKHFIVEKITT